MRAWSRLMPTWCGRPLTLRVSLQRRGCHQERGPHGSAGREAGSGDGGYGHVASRSRKLVSVFFERPHVGSCHGVRIMVANFLVGDGAEANQVTSGLLFLLAGRHRPGRESRPSWRRGWRSSRYAMCYTTMDMATLIGGRVFLGAGAGWMNKEFGVLGAPFQRRVSAWTGISEL
jgi:hypothetical protein